MAHSGIRIGDGERARLLARALSGEGELVDPSGRYQGRQAVHDRIAGSAIGFLARQPRRGQVPGLWLVQVGLDTVLSGGEPSDTARDLVHQDPVRASSWRVMMMAEVSEVLGGRFEPTLGPPAVSTTITHVASVALDGDCDGALSADGLILTVVAPGTGRAGFCGDDSSYTAAWMCTTD